MNVYGRPLSLTGELLNKLWYIKKTKILFCKKIANTNQMKHATGSQNSKTLS
jgi:hypothetical protein